MQLSRRRFQQVCVGEPTVEDTIAILRGLKNVTKSTTVFELGFSNRSSRDAFNRYITSFLPDKAIDLIDDDSLTP